MVTRFASDTLPDNFGIMPASSSNQPTCPGPAETHQKHDLKAHFWSRLEHLVSKLVFCRSSAFARTKRYLRKKGVVSPARTHNFRGALQAKNEKSKKNRVLPARDALFFQPAELRIESLARPSVSFFLGGVSRRRNGMFSRNVFFRVHKTPTFSLPG